MKFLQPASSPEQAEQRRGQRDVSLEFQLPHGQATVGFARIAGDEGQLSVTGAMGRPPEVVIGFCGATILIDAQEGRVEVVAREHEVIELYSEMRPLELGPTDDQHIL